MTNPTKIAELLAPPKVESKPTQPKMLPRGPKHLVMGPAKVSPRLLGILESVAEVRHKEVQEGIANGELDEHGNPVGTEYYPNGVAKRQRKPEKVGPDGRRRRRRTITAGMIFGDLTVLRKGPRVRAARPNLSERWRCKCTCGTELIVPKYYLVRQPNPKTHCGCKVKTLKSTNQREYRIWMMIHQRLFNPKHVSYKHYQEKKIGLEPEWHKDCPDGKGFKRFLEHVGKAPSTGHSLDRVHNNRGYVKGNLKWSTAAEQRANQGDSIGGYSLEQITDWGYTEDEFVKMIIDGTLPKELGQI